MNRKESHVLHLDILSLFPEAIEPYLSSSVLARAKRTGTVDICVTNFRDFSEDRHKTVDDYPFGGGAGMLLKAPPLFAAVDHVRALRNLEYAPRVIMMTPQGRTFNQAVARELKKERHLIFLCGHYEGFDDRVRQHLATDELSIGDFVLTGGELAALVVVDAVVRLMPGVLGNEESPKQDSHENGMLEYPQYTRPRKFREWEVPEVLLSGHHENIEAWRRREALANTCRNRPDLFMKIPLDERERSEIVRYVNGYVEN